MAVAAARLLPDIDKAIELLFAHKLEFIRDFLRSKKLGVTGSKDDLRARLRQALLQDVVDVGEVLLYLDQIEGWGEQHIYLYKVPESVLAVWRDENEFRALLSRSRCLKLLGRPRALYLPKKATLASITRTAGRVRFVWVLARPWEERVKKKDRREGATVYRAYQDRVARNLLAFDVDLATGDAMLMIQSLPSGARYDKERDAMVRMLQPYVDLGACTPVRVSRAIGPLRESGEARFRKYIKQTPTGGELAFSSAARNKGIDDDPKLAAAEDAVGTDTIGRLGNVYWLKTGTKSLEGEVHTTIHAKDQRIAIFGERREVEVRYVVDRIRQHCE